MRRRRGRDRTRLARPPLACEGARHGAGEGSLNRIRKVTRLFSRIYGAHEPVIEELRWLRGLGFENRFGQKVEHAL